MIIQGFDEVVFKEIAKATGNKQTLADIGYAKFVYYHNPKKMYAERIDNDGWILGSINKDSLRIIGMATRKEAQGKGIGTTLLYRAISFCQKNKLKKITTRTLSGVTFYQKKAKARIVGKKDNDYLLEMIV